MKQNKLIVFVGIGFELVGTIVVCIYAGKWIDDNYGTSGLGIGLLPMLGLAGWIYRVVLLAKRMEKSEEEQ